MAGRKRTEPYGLASLEIERFRNMHGIAIPLGQRVTVIAGQNGTGKSTILGMLGQPFGMVSARTVFGKACKTKFTDIFKMSPDYDKPGEHLYYVDFRDQSISNGRQHIQVKSYSRKPSDKSHIRLVTGATRNKGEGNIDFPVIYLGMRRVYPVGEIANPEATSSELDDDETRKFISWYSRIMVPMATSEMEPVKMTKRGQKETLLVNTGQYDYLANSAGQDNLGQILAAIISFQRLKDDLGEDYKGGLLLIDEVDATLFPASQVGLLRLLASVSPELKLQVVMTTHSTDLIEAASGMVGKDGDVEVIYLKSRGGAVSMELNPPMDSVRSDLLIEPLPPVKELKVEIWCEDDEAKWFLSHMMPRRLSSKCSVQSVGLSCGELAELATRDAIPALKNVLFVTDADGVKGAPKRITGCSRLFVLPGGGSSPERSVHDLLLNLPDDDPSWGSFPRNYGKQQFVRLRNEMEDDWRGNGGKEARKFEKLWFRRTKRSGLWGPNGAALYGIWRVAYASEVSAFCEELERRVDVVLRRMEHSLSLDDR